tara:strand:+ start:2111 stop:2962 length:852 start_codon:yes stop_codon:yes gene_type:complete
MSRNRDRLGSNAPQDSSPPQQALQENPGFAFVVPTEFVELPSGGRFYPENHPLHGQSTIEIKQMTAKEEDILTSRTLLKNGVAIDRVIQSLITDKRVNSDSLLVGDRNAILIAARVSGYGNDYNTTVSCPACGTAQEYSFDLKEAYIHSGNDDTALSLTSNDDGTFSTILPRTQVNVVFRLLNGNDEKAMVNQAESARKRNRPEQAVTSQIRSMVVSVNGDNTPQALNYLIENIPSLDARHLRTCYKTASPNIDLTQHFSCENCGHEQEMEVPLTADFFWPDR